MGMYLPSLDAAASALGMESKTGNESDYHTYGNVKSINADGSYQVQLNTSSVTTKCVRGCNASVGNRVIVVIRRDGQAIALAKVGGEAKPTPQEIGALPLAGGTMNHGSQIVRRGKPVSWYNGRDGALLRHTTYEGYNPIFSVKSPAGSWEVGPYTNDWLYFNLISDSSYSSGSNVPAHQYVFTNDGRLLLNNRSAFRGTVLYNNITGTNGTVYLSESVANFSWLRIFYRDNDWFKASIDVHSPQGTYGDLVITAKSPSGIFWTKHRTVSISGSAISSIRYGCYSVYGTAVGGNGDENTNNIWITAVVGYYM